MKTRFATGLLALFVLACGRDIEHFEDEGAICVGMPGGLPADSVTSVWVEFPTCLNPCDREKVHAECEVELDEGLIVVHSRGATRETSVLFGDCPAVCGLLIAECEMPALPAGEYSLRHGQAEMTVTVPSEDPICHLDE